MYIVRYVLIAYSDSNHDDNEYGSNEYSSVLFTAAFPQFQLLRQKQYNFANIKVRFSGIPIWQIQRSCRIDVS